MKREPKVKWRDWLAVWGLSSLRISAGFLDLTFSPTDADRKTAWELYVELITRIATQIVPGEYGDEAAALESVHSLFPTTRAILRANGAGAIESTKLAVVVLNQIVRPFTTEWHSKSGNGAFSDPEGRKKFRADLAIIQGKLANYSRALAMIANVEDLSTLEAPPPEAGKH